MVHSDLNQCFLGLEYAFYHWTMLTLIIIVIVSFFPFCSYFSSSLFFPSWYMPQQPTDGKPLIWKDIWMCAAMWSKFCFFVNVNLIILPFVCECRFNPAVVTAFLTFLTPSHRHCWFEFQASNSLKPTYLAWQKRWLLHVLPWSPRKREFLNVSLMNFA